ncbi:MAG: efflux RND transporter periplasmic adaptor subunit, partial [Microcystaceae cyanobacterium]
MSKTPFTRHFYPAVLLLSCLTVACNEAPQKAAAPPSLPVKLQTIESSMLTDSSEFVGNLVASEFVQLAPKIDGRIVKIYAFYGQSVKKNVPILLLEPTQQQEQVNASVGNLNIQRASLDRTDADLRTAEAQRDAAKSEVLSQQANIANSQANLANSQANLANSREVLKTKEADLKRAQSTLNLAGINFKRSTFLVETGVQPQQDLDNKTTDLKDSEAGTEAASKTVQAAKASVNASQANVGASKASVDAAKAVLKQAKDNLRAAEERVTAARADINRQKAAIAQAKGQLGVNTQELIFNRVLSPIDGIVGNIPYKVGDFIRTGENFTTITNNSEMEMDVNVPTERIKELRKGLSVEIIKQDNSVDAVGEISFISPTVDQKSQTVLVKVSFRNDGRLKNNQYVRVRLIWERRPGVLIPTTAITTVGAQKFVFVAERGKTPAETTDLVAKQKPVTVGKIEGQSYQVLSGVETGQKVA